jgi:hypothetical protein
MCDFGFRKYTAQNVEAFPTLMISFGGGVVSSYTDLAL